MNVVQICHDYHPPFPHICRLYGACFERDRFELETVFLRGTADSTLANNLPGKVTFLELPAGSLSGLKLKAMYRLMRLLREKRPQLIIAHRFKPIYLSAIAAHRVGAGTVIGVAHELGMFKRPGRRWLARLLRSKLRLVGVSDFVAADLKASLPGYPADHITAIPNGIDITRATNALLPKEEARLALDIPVSAKVIGTMGRMIAKKNQALLLEAFAVWPNKADWLLVLMGNGRLRKKLEARAQSLGIIEQTLFLGFVPEGSRYAAIFDLFVLTSRAEPFGMVLLEAMVAGVTVLGPNSGAAPEIVPDRAYVFDELTPGSLLKTIEYAKDHPVDKEQLEKFLQAKYSLSSFRKNLTSQTWLMNIKNLNR